MSEEEIKTDGALDPEKDPELAAGSSAPASEPEGDAQSQEEANPNLLWYVAHTYSGYENKVKSDIEQTVKNREDLKGRIVAAAVPTEKATVVKDGKSRTVDRKLFPGYVYVKMIMDDQTWYVVRNTNGVTGFVGPGSKPQALSRAEIAQLGLEQRVASERPVEFAGNIGDTVRIITGAWTGSNGIIRDINDRRQEITLGVEVFNRETPLTVKFGDVELIRE